MVRRRHLHSPVITAAGSTAAVTPLLEQTTCPRSIIIIITVISLLPFPSRHVRHLNQFPPLSPFAFTSV